jgi:hypothetical protein
MGKAERKEMVIRGGGSADTLGKLPLALQQLGLAADRAQAQGDAKLATLIRAKMKELLPIISGSAIEGAA